MLSGKQLRSPRYDTTREILSLYNSAKRDFGVSHLRAERLYRTLSRNIDTERLSALQKAVYEHHCKDASSAAKYPFLRYWLRVNVVRALALNLDDGRRRKILDIGAGTGLFMFVCAALGHEVAGIDVGPPVLTDLEQKVFIEMRSILGVEVQENEVRFGKSLKDFGEFDLVVSYLVCFNNHKRHDEWGAVEWDWFLKDVKTILPTGRLFLQLNENRQRYPDLKYYDAETLNTLQQYAKVKGPNIELDGS